ncbi:MAG: PQQ-binding-like beta-propeller repeat protein [Bacteroidota bacterium]
MKQYLKLKVPIFLCISFLGLFGSCRKQPMEVPAAAEACPSSSEELEIIWQAPLGIEEREVPHFRGVTLADDKVVASPTKNDFSRATVSFWDKQTGELQFAWNDWNSTWRIHIFYPLQIVNDNVYANAKSHSALIDPTTGQTVWTRFHDFNNVRSSSYSIGKIFQPANGENDCEDSPSIDLITCLDQSSGQRDTILTVEKPVENAILPILNLPSGWNAPSGDSLLFFSSWSKGEEGWGWTAYGYNMTKSSFIWQLYDNSFDEEPSEAHPLVSNGLVYFLGPKTLYCLDAQEGAIVWQQNFNVLQGSKYTILFSVMNIFNRKLIVSLGNGEIYCFDPSNGFILWKTRNGPTHPQNLVHHNGVIYMADRNSRQLHAHDIKTGECYWRQESPNLLINPSAGFRGVIAVDPETGYLYADDGFFVMCIRPYDRG